MKNKYIWILSFLGVIAFSFLMMFCNPALLSLHSKYPAKVSPEKETELRELIFNLKNSVNEELLEKFHISVDSRLQPVADSETYYEQQYNMVYVCLTRAMEMLHIFTVPTSEFKPFKDLNLQ